MPRCWVRRGVAYEQTTSVNECKHTRTRRLDDSHHRTRQPWLRSQWKPGRPQWGLLLWLRVPVLANLGSVVWTRSIMLFLHTFTERFLSDNVIYRFGKPVLPALLINWSNSYSCFVSCLSSLFIQSVKWTIAHSCSRFGEDGYGKTSEIRGKYVIFTSRTSVLFWRLTDALLRPVGCSLSSSLKCHNVRQRKSLPVGELKASVTQRRIIFVMKLLCLWLAVRGADLLVEQFKSVTRTYSRTAIS